MLLFYKSFFAVVWIIFMVYWRIKSIGTKSTQRIEPVASRVLREIALAIVIILVLFNRIPLPWLYRYLWPSGLWSFWVGAAVTVAGLLFAVWARLHLATNWSSSVTIKQGHELITSGPYRLVRHPIYTGILTGFLGTAIALSQVRGFIALAIMFAAFWAKFRTEEQFMRTQFGETYATYSRKTAALVPYLF
jgi:protein-S-isoprenylcysteine O-methyltransferase Ste14